MPFARVNGIEMYYESHGTGFPVVFAHGRGGNHLSWWQQIPAFSARYRCITFDHREFGRSKEIPDGPGRTAFVEDLRCLLDHLGIERTHFVGQSMGGGTGLGFAMAFPHRVAGLVLADTSAGIAENEILRDFQERASSLPKDASLRAISNDFRIRAPDFAFLYAEIGRLSYPVRESFEDYLTSDVGPRGHELAKFKIPTLVIVGENDIVVTPNIAKLVCKYISHAALKIVSGAGHSVYFEKPDEFNKLVLDFLSRLDT